MASYCGYTEHGTYSLWHLDLPLTDGRLDAYPYPYPYRYPYPYP